MNGLNVSGPHVRGHVHATEGDASGDEISGGFRRFGLRFAVGFRGGSASCNGERGEKSEDE